jgi:hypothetical protein
MMHHGAERIETVRLPLDDQGEMSRGDVVALHWDYVCQVLSPRQHEHLVRYHDRHLAIANHGSDSLASLIET